MRIKVRLKKHVKPLLWNVKVLWRRSTSLAAQHLPLCTPSPVKRWIYWKQRKYFFSFYIQPSVQLWRRIIRSTVIVTLCDVSDSLFDIRNFRHKILFHTFFEDPLRSALGDMNRLEVMKGSSRGARVTITNILKTVGDRNPDRAAIY